MEMFDKVINIKKAKDPKELKKGEQAKLFEQEEILVPKKALAMLNNKMSNQQKELEKQNEQLQEQNTQLQEQNKTNTRLANSIEALLPEIGKA